MRGGRMNAYQYFITYLGNCTMLRVATDTPNTCLYSMRDESNIELVSFLCVIAKHLYNLTITNIVPYYC